MSFNYTGSYGLFVRLGHIIQEVNEINTFRGPNLGAPSAGSPVPNFGYRLATIQGDFDGNSVSSPAIPDQSLVDTLFTQASAFRQVAAGQIGYIQTVAQNTIVKVINDYAPQPINTFNNAINYLTFLMSAGSYVPGSWAATIQQSTISIGAVTAGGSNTGNGILVLTGVGTHGQNHQYIYPETLTATCIRDQSNGAIVNQEVFNIVGGAAQGVLTDWTWPLGSGTNGSLTTVDATLNNAGGNLLTNSDFETFSGNIPLNWTSVITTPGTTIQAGGSGNAYTGVNCLQIIGTGAAELTAIGQLFGNGTTGTFGTLKANTVYAASCVVKVSSTPAAGVLKMALVDAGNTYTPFNNDAGVALAATLSLTSVSTSYVRFTGIFATPTELPAAPAFLLKMSTAIDSGKSVFIDHLALTPMTLLYPGGIRAAIFSGDDSFAQRDNFTSVITNTMGKFVKGMWQIFNIPNQSLTYPIPYSGSPTISDNLVV